MSAATVEAAFCLEQEIKQEINMAFEYLYNTSAYDESFNGRMTAALAHTNIAMLKQRELDGLRAA